MEKKFLLLFCFILSPYLLNAQLNIQMVEPVQNAQPGTVLLAPDYVPAEIKAYLNNEESDVQPVIPTYINDNFFQYDNKVKSVTNRDFFLNPRENAAYVVNKNGFVKEIVKEYPIDSLSGEAINRAPKWLSLPLRMKFRILHNYINIERALANLILNCEKKVVDEVAFQVAYLSIQTLTDSRFQKDINCLVRNADMIYKTADSLHYVQLVEHSDGETGDFYTTTKYKILQGKDTIYSEIPKEYYYWFIVMPKFDQEGVYTADNNSDQSGQRTYGYLWRDYIWYNPDPTHDYTKVNITTSKGTVNTIERFGKLIQTPKVLWDRVKTYLPFNRPFLPENSALDVIGNWASRAIPVDAVLPRSFQPNHCLYSHHGNCNEDAFLTVAACRTALIPAIYSGMWHEDHVYGQIWDMDWNHYEFFRGGLQSPGNQFFGITNMLDRGSYGWVSSFVQGFRPDGFTMNQSRYYNDVATLEISVTDSLGQPVDGAKINLYAYTSTNDVGIAGYVWTDMSGKASIEVGTQKAYLFQVYHPVYGWLPSDSTQAYYATSNQLAVKNQKYISSYKYPKDALNGQKINELPASDIGNVGIVVKFNTKEIVTGINPRETQKSRFYNWLDNGSVSIFVCDSVNYQKYINNQNFDAYRTHLYSRGGKIGMAFPDDKDYYLVISNKPSACNLEYGSVEISVIEDLHFGVETTEESSKVLASPNPFTEYCNLNIIQNVQEADIYDAYGRFVQKIYPPFTWRPAENIESGTYFIKINNGKKAEVIKAVYVK